MRLPPIRTTAGSPADCFYWDGTNWQTHRGASVEYTLEMTGRDLTAMYVLYVDHGFSGPHAAKFDGSTWRQGIIWANARLPSHRTNNTSAVRLLGRM